MADDFPTISPAPEDRMFCYLWYEVSDPGECKFGERWVKAGESPLEEIWKRIRQSVGVRKDLVNEGRIKLEHLWDVTEYAKKVKRYYQRSRVDDHIRPHIGFRKGSTGEIHQLPPIEARIKVDKLLAQIGQPLPMVGLAAWQARTAEKTLRYMYEGNQTILANLCARFGKTIWSGVLIRETKAPLTVIVSYVLTSFSSFEKDLTRFEQFKDLVILDSADPEYQEIAEAALNNGKQVVVFLSMCNGTKRGKKIEHIFGLDYPRLIIVDEADFGVHKIQQAKPLINAMGPRDKVILMTGTNADKAASIWPVDSMISVVYPELVMEKRNKQASYPTTLENFEVDPTRHDLVVDIQFYQMDLRRAVEFARQMEPELFVDDGIYLPSWSKAAADPIKAKGFITRILQGIFLGQHGWDELNVDLQTGRRTKAEGQRVAMMFVSGSTTNDNLEEIVGIARSALMGYHVVAVYGEEMTNRTAEPDVKQEIELAARRGQDVLLISAGMAQRSFSVGEITELYLAYDQGDAGATTQKISRALTPDQIGKIGRIISLSFDPNRDDKFDALLLETALNHKRNHEIDSARESLDIVIKTMDIFRCTEDGAIRICPDDYLKQALERNSISRVCGKIADHTLLSIAELKALADGNSESFRDARAETADRGKTRFPGRTVSATKHRNEDLASAKLIAAAKVMIATIVENLDIILLGTNQSTIKNALDDVKKDPDKSAAISEEFGIDIDIICDLIDRGVINMDLVELSLDQQYVS